MKNRLVKMIKSGLALSSGPSKSCRSGLRSPETVTHLHQDRLSVRHVRGFRQHRRHFAVRRRPQDVAEGEVGVGHQQIPRLRSVQDVHQPQDRHLRYTKGGPTCISL